MSEYSLSASLEGHEDDVRGVIFPDTKFICSASRDATVRIWKLENPSPPKFDCSISSHGSAFINAITYVKPTSQYPEGLVVSGGKDTIIEVRKPGKAPEENAEGLLLGHSHNVCSLDVTPDGKHIISGSWDGSARVWSIGGWECETVLEGHSGSVWAVLAYDGETIITGCADKLIRVFTPAGKQLHTIRGTNDVVRALCKLPRKHSSQADFASASNDGIIRLWQLRGRQVAELHGHESFIYALASTPSGDIVSSGEDRTVRIWRDNACLQTITHPAISVWSIAVCAENGDIVSGASDRIVRVFTKSSERRADPQVIAAFEESVKSSSIPQQQVGEVNKEKLPGPEFLQQKSGTKEGQVVMIRQPDGSVTAHQWSVGGKEWVNVGTVVDAVGSSGKKKTHRGKDYDYVFDVDVEEGKPALKLPYNLSQNPYDAATKFVTDHELPGTYLEQVANFIITNTQGATIGQTQEQPAGADPWGTESRYRPGDAQSTSSYIPPPKATSKKAGVLPQKAYLSITTANLSMIEKKIGELNDQLVQEGFKDDALDAQSVNALKSVIKQLGNSKVTADAMKSGMQPILSIATRWPEGRRVPGLDLLRLLASATTSLAEYSDSVSGNNIITLLSTSGVFSDPDRPNNIMLAMRVLVNLFDTEKGRILMDKELATVTDILGGLPKVTGNKNLNIAIATLCINYSVLLTDDQRSHLPSSTDHGITLVNHPIAILSGATDSEEAYRAFVAAGTLLTLGEDVQAAATEIYGLNAALQQIEARFGEPRIKSVIAEIRNMLA
ncbi:hypothetical protein MMC25_003566 [Agyrium rufum]|nr:hypothetical protein [Agyrium rufum]